MINGHLDEFNFFVDYGLKVNFTLYYNVQIRYRLDHM